MKNFYPLHVTVKVYFFFTEGALWRGALSQGQQFWQSFEMFRLKEL